MPIPAPIIERPRVRPMTKIFNRVWFYPPKMPDVFRESPVPVVRVEPQVDKQPTSQEETFYDGIIHLEDIFEVR